MPTLSSKHSSDPIKMLNIGDSGGGKTGALASLVNAGYSLFILDYDNGTDILESLITTPEGRARVRVETLTDMGRLTGIGTSQKIVKLNPQAFVKGLTLLNRWVDSETKEDFGPVASWGQDRILVIDSLSFMGGAALDFIVAKNGRSGEAPWESDWGDAMRMIEQGPLSILFSSEVKCHVIINTHIDYQQPAGSLMVQGLPMALGKRLSPKVARYFNVVMQTKTKGQAKVILTKSQGLVEVKCPLLSAPPELPIETGLATFFDLWKKQAASLSPPEPAGAVVPPSNVTAIPAPQTKVQTK